MATIANAEERENSSNPKHTIWLEGKSDFSHMRKNRDMTYIAYVPAENVGLNVIKVETGDIYQVTDVFTGGSYFWSPDGARLFYRELKSRDGVVTTSVKAWDAVVKKSVAIQDLAGSSGHLTFDPFENRLMMMHGKGILNRRLVFPDEKLANWQMANRLNRGRFLASNGGMTFLTQNGFVMSKLIDDDSGVESFDLSFKGDSMVWATKYGRIYLSKLGEAPKFIDYGRDPQWHPSKAYFVYAGARMVGNKAASYDLKVSSAFGTPAFLTNTQKADERWPFWSPDGQEIIFTETGSKKLFKTKLVEAGFRE
ncbi:MAG: hypothetical protein NT027_18735 [Proteobacteria bacterium]|nr:hypothetical protein [Pseudomonadota bacterium]